MNRFKVEAEKMLARWYAPWKKAITGLLGTLLIFAAGVGLFGPPADSESFLSRASYDWSFDLTSAIRPSLQDSEAVIVYLDRSYTGSLTQPGASPFPSGTKETDKLALSGEFRDRDQNDRHQLTVAIRRLIDEGARAIVVDADLSGSSGNSHLDFQLVEAIRRHGKVILGVEMVPGHAANSNRNRNELFNDSLTYEAAAAVGVSSVQKDLDFTVRRHSAPGPNGVPSLAWAAAAAVNAEVTREPHHSRGTRWMNYYGSPGTVPDLPFALLNEPATTPPKFFRGKTVFIGHRPLDRDEFRNPYTRWTTGNRLMPKLEVHATEYLNLARSDWLSRPSPVLEYMMLLAVSAVLGFGLSRLRTLQSTLIVGCGALAFTVIVLSLFANHCVWFPWMAIVAVQIPLGLLWGITCYSSELYAQRRRLEEERQRAIEQIREQAALLDKAQDAIIVHDLEWRASFWNKSAERLYGWTSTEVVNESLSDRILNGEHDKLLDARQSVLRTGEWTGELMQKTKTGTHLLVQSRWSLVRDPGGQPKSILVINTDITERKRLESQFLRAQRMESIGTLAGGIAHDLNNMLAPIMMGVEFLQYKTSDENSQKLLATMASSARRGADLVKQVLTFARGHDGERAPLQLIPLLKEMQKILLDTFPKSIQVDVRFDQNLQVVLGDATQLHQVILNLCVNARDAMPDGGTLILEADNCELRDNDAKRLLTSRPGTYVRLRVTDTGLGIPPEIQEKIFEPFFTTKQLGKGTGLGLSTVMSIVKSHGGLVELHSTPGQGTCFEILIPALAATAVVPAMEQLGEGVTGGSECVLIIDDETAILEVIRTVLTQNGYRVLVAHHGADAVALCLRTSETIHLVITDMMMPVMDGPRAMRALRELRPELRFIAMSGLQQSDQIREQIGDATFVPKPFSGDRLLRVVREVLSNRGGETKFYRRSFGPDFATEVRARFDPIKA